MFYNYVKHITMCKCFTTREYLVRKRLILYVTLVHSETKKVRKTLKSDYNKRIV